MWSQELQHLLFSCLYWNTLCPNRQGVLLQTTACRRTSTKSSHTPPPPPKVWCHHEGQHLWFTAITMDLNRNTVNDEKVLKHPETQASPPATWSSSLLSICMLSLFQVNIFFAKLSLSGRFLSRYLREMNHVFFFKKLDYSDLKYKLQSKVFSSHGCI